MNDFELQLIEKLREVKSEARAGILSAVIQCVGGVSEECGREIRKILAEKDNEN